MMSGEVIMAKTIDARVSLLEKLSTDNDEVMLIDDTIEGKMYYVRSDGVNEEVTQEEYLFLKDNYDVVIFTLQFAHHWHPHQVR